MQWRKIIRFIGLTVFIVGCFLLGIGAVNDNDPQFIKPSVVCLLFGGILSFGATLNPNGNGKTSCACIKKRRRPVQEPRLIELSVRDGSVIPVATMV